MDEPRYLGMPAMKVEGKNLSDNCMSGCYGKYYEHDIKKLTDEIERLREALHEIYRKCDNDRIMWMVDEALQQKDSE